MAHRRSGSRQVRSRRKTSWEAGVGGTVLTTLTALGSAFMGAAVTPTIGALTIVRMRGLFDIYMQGPGASDGDGMFGAVGIGLATTAAVTAGIASVPTPLTELGDENWLWHSFWSVHNEDTTFGHGAAAHQRIEIDSKAMRKFEDGMSIYAAIEVGAEDGTAIIDARLDSRVLVLIP